MEVADVSFPRLSLPEQAHEFIDRAERAFNSRDVEANCAAYTNQAIVEFWTDGIHDRLTGIEEIRRGWSAIFAAMPRFSLKKKIILVDRLVIVNEWTGSINGRERQMARGAEVWRFDETGRVAHHQLYNFLHIHEADTWLGKAIFGFAHPIVAVRLEWNRRRW